MNFILILFLLLVLSVTGEAIKCWDCDSNLDLSCGDPFSNATVIHTDCNRVSNGHFVNSYRCRKIIRPCKCKVKTKNGF